MSYRYLICLILLNLYVTVEAQVPITGSVLDESEEPLPAVNVLLLDPEDSTMVKGGVTDEAGTYHLENVAPATYLLSVSMVGYQAHSIPSIKVGYNPVQLDPVILRESVEQLDEIAVTAQKPLFELKQDRIVMNVGANPVTDGNTGLQLLQKTPGVLVDRQNNSISMGAKGEVLVLINDKIQRIPASALMAQLQGMRAENIEQIEVIHQPPARYDASGAAGIINIVLKRDDREGTNGSVSLTAGYGQREKAGFSLILNSRKGKFNWYGDYNYNRNRANEYEINHFREYDSQGNSYYAENFVTLRNYREGQHTGNMGVDIDFDGLTILGFRLGGTLSEQVWGSGAESRSFDFVNDDLTGETGYLFGSITDMSSLTANVNLYQKIGTSSQLNFDLDYASVHYDNSGELRDVLSPGQEIVPERSTPMDFWIGSLDNVNEWDSGWKLETGIKGTFNNTLSTTTVQNQLDEDWTGAAIFQGTGRIKERIFAAYGSVSKKFSEKFDAELGMRYEHYTYRLDQNNQDDIHQVFKNPFPVFRLNYTMDSEETLQLGYNRSITRPSFSSLTSFFALFDPSLVVYANPQLQPTFTNTVRITYQRGSTVISLAHISRENQIYFYNTVNKEEHLQTSTPTNLDQENLIDANLSFPLYPAHWWEINWNLNAFYHKIKDKSSRSAKLEKDIFTYTVQLNSTFTLGKDWSIGMDGRYMSRFLSGDQEQYISPYINTSLKKEFQSGNSLSIAIQDILNTSGKIEWEYNQPDLGIRTFGNNNFSERQIRVTFTLSFGNNNISGKRERTTGSEEEVNSRM